MTQCIVLQEELDIHSNASLDVESISDNPLYKLVKLEFVVIFTHIVNSVNEFYEWNKFSP